MKLYRLSFLVLFVPALATAHIGITTGPALAKTNQKVTFAINHGCHETPTGPELDTYAVKIDIPAGIDGTTVRAMPSDFGRAVITKNGNAVTSVKWTRPTADLQAAGDLGYYEITLKMKTNDVPFTKIPFVVTQYCKNANGDDVVLAWDDTTTAEPSPRLIVVPQQHERGWNKLTLTTAVAVAEFGDYFGDALIVWKGTSAYSKTKAVSEAIGTTPGVTLLATDLAAGDEIWVKY